MSYEEKEEKQMNLDFESDEAKEELFTRIKESDYKIKLKKRPNNNRRLDIFANGPSLLDTADVVQEIDSDVMVLNDFLKSNLEENFNIKWYVIADPNYMDEENREDKERIEKYIKNSKGIKLIMPDYIYRKWEDKDFIQRFVIGVNSRSIFYLNVGKEEFELFEKNDLAPAFQNVLVLAIYAGIQLGYGEIYVHGCDFSFIQQTHMERGKLYNQDKHFYNQEGVKYYWSFGYMELLKYIRIALMAMKELKDYADYENVKIINMSKNSFIEHFEFYDNTN